MGKSTAKSVLVINSGSSSIKYALFNFARAAASCVFQGSVEGIGTSKSSITHRCLQTSQDIKILGSRLNDHEAGLKKVTELLQQPENVCAVGHRVVHGGEGFSLPTHITESVKRAIERAVPLAPLHNPANLEGIRVAGELFKCPHVAVFDTAFHATIPRTAYLYGLPWELYEQLGVRRYGFHGTSYQFILEEACKQLNKPKHELNIIALHLGAGSSMCAIRQGKSVDTTMGVTPLEGLVMATRSGDVDPAIWTLLASQRGMSVEEIDKLLNKESGLYGLCGEKDVKTLVEAAESGSERHMLALDIYVHRIRKYLGAYLVQLEGKVDALVFTGGVGERSGVVRRMVCRGLEVFGIEVDEEKNAGNSREIDKDSRVKVLVIPTDEQLCIAQQTYQVFESLEAGPVHKRSGE